MDLTIKLSLLFNPFPNDKFLDSSKLKVLAEEDFKFDECGGKFSKSIENTVGKGEIARFSRSVFKRPVLQTRKNQGLLERSSDLSNSGEFKRQTVSEIAI